MHFTRLLPIKYWLVTIFYCFHHLLLAQVPGNVSLNNVIDPSPISAAFDRYKDYPVSLFTGVPEINIPIYTIQSGDLTLPISISYHASGIKMSDVSYPVGLGWSLSATGRVSRTVRDKPDGIAASINTLPPNTTQKEIYKVGMYSLDTDPDIFSYNTAISGSNSGRFLFDGETLKNGDVFTNPVFFPQYNNKFKYLSENAMVLTDENGRAFTYGGLAKTETSNYITNTGLPSPYTSAWLLSEILPVSQQISDKITFNYTPGPTIQTCSTEGSFTIIDSIANTMHGNATQNFPHFDKVYGLCAKSPGFYTGYIYDSQAQLMRVENNALNLAYISNVIHGTSNNYPNFVKFRCQEYPTSNVSSIVFKDGRAEFTYDPTKKFLQQIKIFNSNDEVIRIASFYYSRYTNCNWGHYKLDKLVIGGLNEINPQEYTFTYEQGVAETNYSSKDHWGYFNGANNTTPIPRWIDVPVLTLTGWSNGLPNNSYVNVEIGTAWRDSEETFMKRYIIKRLTTPTKGYSEFEFESNKYELNGELKQVGGLRIKSIRSYDGINKPIIKSYLYGINNSGAGIPMNIPSYKDYVTEGYLLYDHIWSNCGGGVLKDCYPVALSPFYARRRYFSSSPRKDISYTDGSSVWYTHVEERTLKENGESLGKTTFEFELPELNQELNYYTSNQTKLDLKFVQWFNGFNFPNLKEKKIYKSISGAGEVKYSPIKSYKYEYTNTQSMGTKAYNYPYFSYLSYNEGIEIGQASDPFYQYDEHFAVYNPVIIESGEIASPVYKVKKETVADYVLHNGNKLDSIVKKTDYSYGEHFFPVLIQTSLTSGRYEVKSLKYPSDYKNLTATDSLTKGIINLKNNNVLSTSVEEIINILDENSSNKGVSSATIKSFKIGKPLLDRVYSIENKDLVTSFNESNVVNGSIKIDPGYKEQIRFDKYNDEGDILEHHAVNDMPISYIWGYNNQYPIAEAKNTLVKDIFYTSFEESQSSIIGDSKTGKKYLNGTFTQSLSNLSNGDYLLTYWEKSDSWKLKTSTVKVANQAYTINITGIIDEVRFHPKKAAMITYTYDVLKGRTSETGPNYITVYYSYDDMGRLECIRDQKRDIIKTFNYNYKVTDPLTN